ncbi:MAG: ABC transporter ATP-binding protein [Acidobacteriota bacterium]
MPAVIAARRLSKWYGQVVGLLEADFELEAGVIGLLGPNGAGKSTLMALLTGQLQPSQGEAFVFGENAWNNPRLMLRLGLCPEQDAFYEWMTGVGFLTVLLCLHGYAEADAERQALEALEIAGMKEHGRKKLGAMSKGMRQRVKLAQALAHHPDVLVLDEPLNGMDPLGRRETVELVKALGRAGKTVLISSHILHEVEAMTKSVLLVHNGRVKAHGNIHEIRELLDDHPRLVAIRCEDGRRLAQALVTRPDVVSVELPEDGGPLVAKTLKADLFYSELPEVAAKLAIPISEISSPDDNLAAVFDYLVKS